LLQVVLLSALNENRKLLRKKKQQQKKKETAWGEKYLLAKAYWLRSM